MMRASILRLQDDGSQRRNGNLNGMGSIHPGYVFRQQILAAVAKVAAAVEVRIGI
jgi:hypothetical protein